MGRIALVEDNQDSAELIQAVLADEHDVQWFETADGFLNSFNTESFDLVLLDISLPKTDGHELYETIRRKNPTIAVIIVSAHAQPEAIRDAISKGACDYVVKPILDLERFRATVRRNIGGGRSD